MQRISGWVIVLLLLALAGYLYHVAPNHVLISMSDMQPHEAAERVAGLVKGDGPNFAASPFTSGQWWPDGASVIANAAIAPDGTKTAYRLVESAGSGFHRLGSTLTLSVGKGVRTLSLYVKAAERQKLQFEMADSPMAKYGVARFDLLNKTVVAEIGDVVDAGIQELPNGWYRCWAAMPYSNQTETFNFALMDQTGQVRHQGDKDDGLFIWGSQFEPGEEPGGYSERTATQ